MSERIGKQFRLAMKKLKSQSYDATAIMAIEIEKVVPDMITSAVSKGISPIAGRGRFPEYSESYKKQIDPAKYTKNKLKESGFTPRETSYVYKTSGMQARDYVRSLKNRFGKKERPVNLKLTGDMIDSMETRLYKGATFNAVEFDITDPKYTKHHYGIKTPVRRILPDRGEEFYGPIQRVIIKIIKQVTNKMLGR